MSPRIIFKVRLMGFKFIMTRSKGLPLSANRCAFSTPKSPDKKGPDESL